MHQVAAERQFIALPQRGKRRILRARAALAQQVAGRLLLGLDQRLDPGEELGITEPTDRLARRIKIAEASGPC